jgi:hypothetical protein
MIKIIQMIMYVCNMSTTKIRIISLKQVTNIYMEIQPDVRSWNMKRKSILKKLNLSKWKQKIFI